MARGRGAPSAFAARTGGGGAALRSFGGGDDLDLLEPALPPPAAAAAAGYRAGESPARGALAAGCYVDAARARASPRLEAVGSQWRGAGVPPSAFAAPVRDILARRARRRRLRRRRRPRATQPPPLRDARLLHAAAAAAVLAVVGQRCGASAAATTLFCFLCHFMYQSQEGPSRTVAHCV